MFLSVAYSKLFVFIFIYRPGNKTDVANAVQDLLEQNRAGIISAFSSIDWSEEMVQEFVQGIEGTGIYQICRVSSPVRAYHEKRFWCFIV